MNAKEIWHDPVVEEIHRVREAIAEKHHHDLDAIAKAAEEKSLALGFKVAAPEPRSTDSVVAKAS
jgi:hypothetical protein